MLCQGREKDANKTAIFQENGLSVLFFPWFQAVKGFDEVLRGPIFFQCTFVLMGRAYFPIVLQSAFVLQISFQLNAHDPFPPLRKFRKIVLKIFCILYMMQSIAINIHDAIN